MRTLFNLRLVLFALIWFKPAVYAQDSLPLKRLVFSTSVLDYCPHPALATINCNLGAEIYLKKQWSLYCNAGVLLPIGAPSGQLGTPSERSNGFKIRLEARRYLGKHKVIEPAMLLFWPHVFQYHSKALQNSGFYLGINTYYQLTHTEKEEQIVDYIDYSSPSWGHTYYKSNLYTVHRTAISLNALLGYQCVKSGNFTVDYAVGFGLLYINSYSTNRLGSDQNYPNSVQDWAADKYFDHGIGFGFNLLYQVRLGWAL